MAIYKGIKWTLEAWHYVVALQDDDATILVILWMMKLGTPSAWQA